jgi:hypothetical protein
MKQLDLDEITKIFDKNTTLKGCAIVRDTLAGDLRAIGRIIDITTAGVTPGTVRVSLYVPKTEVPTFSVMADFSAEPDSELFQFLQSRRKGAVCEIRGKLGFVSPKQLVLKECEFYEPQESA